MCFLTSILVRMQAGGAGAESNVVAVPQAGAAVHALLAIEDRHAAGTLGTWPDGLAGADLDAQLRGAPPAKLRIGKADVIGVSVRRLHLSADQQSVLMR